LKAPPRSAQRRRHLGAWVLGAAAILLAGNPELRAAALAQAERVAELAGLGLQQVTLTGQHFAADTDIYAALELDRFRTLLSFDAAAAKDRLEQLPWVESATIEREAPDGINVAIVERVPFAVWHVDNGSWLIDRAGRKLEAVAADAMPELPRVAGAGAGPEAAQLSALLARYPAIAGRVELAERVGERRWRLHMAGGGSVELPAEGEAAALVRLTRLVESGLGNAKRVDLRVSTRTLIEGLGRTDTAAAAAPAGRT
jgi:cell division protein FtsQ